MRNHVGFVPWQLRSVLAGAALLHALLLASPADANHIIQACGEYCTTSCPDPLPPGCRQTQSGSCILGGDFTCTSGQRITLQGGAHLDMDGHSLTCVSSQCSGGAIKMEASSSKVFNSDPTSPGVIQGPFINGVECGGLANSEVDGITIHDVLFGTYDCRKVHHNLIGRALLYAFGINVGIYSATFANTDFIRENYLQDRAFAVWIGNGDFNVDIEDNVIETTPGASPSAGAAIAFNFSTSTSDAVVRRNVVLGTGATIYGSPFPQIFSAPGTLSQATFESNVCGRAHPDCSNCQGQGYCLTPQSPFAW
jgi:hypothetical protein